MPIVEVTIKFAVPVDYIPPDIYPGTDENGVHEPPVSGAEQIAYNLLEKLHQYLPDKAYGFVQAFTVLPSMELVPNDTDK